VLIAEEWNSRVQLVKITDGSWMRFFGEDELDRPQFVDCNTDVIAVSEACHRVSVLSWADGVVLARFGSSGSGPGELQCPAGLRLLSDGRHIVVCDSVNGRISGVQQEAGLVCSLRCTGVHVASLSNDRLAAVSRRDGAVVGTYGRRGTCDGEFDEPCAMAALPDGGLIVREHDGMRFQVFKGLALCMAWIEVCVKASGLFVV
jgi:hypothetical protein